MVLGLDDGAGGGEGGGVEGGFGGGGTGRTDATSWAARKIMASYQLRRTVYFSGRFRL